MCIRDRITIDRRTLHFHSMNIPLALCIVRCWTFSAGVKCFTCLLYTSMCWLAVAVVSCWPLVLQIGITVCDCGVYISTLFRYKFISCYVVAYL